MKATYNKENKIYTDKISNQLLNGGSVMTKYECEYCMEYPLKSYVIDELGGVYCNKHCHKQMNDNVNKTKWKIIKEVA